LMPERMSRFSQSGSGASEPNAKGDYHKMIVTLGFSFARIRDTSCLS
jgi:hypothetical protein